MAGDPQTSRVTKAMGVSISRMMVGPLGMAMHPEMVEEEEEGIEVEVEIGMEAGGGDIREIQINTRATNKSIRCG